MPKQVHNILTFHGGLNNNADPRDIADNQLSVADQVMVDEIGKIRVMGSNVAHDATSNPTVDINPGYGLFQFSHDRLGAELSGVLTVDDLTPSVSDYWETGQTHTNISQTSSSGNGEGIICNITTDGSGDPTFSIVTAGYNYVIDEVIVFTDPGSTSETTNIVVATLTYGEGVPETGDDYLVLADTDGSASVAIYSKSGDTWGTGVVDLGITTGMKPVFYQVDGALRVSDGNFGADNTSRWYGYINRVLFPDVSPSYTIDQWYEEVQVISAPRTSYWDEDEEITGDVGPQSHTDTGSTSADDVSSTRVALSSAGLGDIIRATVDWQYTVTGAASVSLVITCGVYTGSFQSSAQSKSVATGWKLAGTYTGQTIFNFSATDTTTGTGGTHGTWTDFRSEFTTDTGDATHGILSMLLNEASVMTDLSAKLTNDNVFIEFDWETNTGATGWNNTANTGAWEVGISFIYDGVQESQITTLVDKDDSTVTTMPVADVGATAAPVIRFYIADFATIGTPWNKRITGCNMYMKDVIQDTTQPWFLQLSADFETGKMRVDSTQKDYDIKYFAESNQEYYYWEIGVADAGTIGANESEMLEPSLVSTYEINSGIEENEKSITSMYKTAVVVGRRVYIGGLQVEYKDGTKEIKGDAMIKSPVNRFDLFPLSRIIEASIQDGDEIVKLEEYADRILQFKKNKMHLINVSQEIEFLEDTFMHKGVSSPAAVCKTDFGVAWVNEFGCYLYDGNKVNNLLEKGGMQIIKDFGSGESDWSTFIVSPQIGYIPKKRQLIVVDDNDGNGDGEIFLFDLVTQSWVYGQDDIFTDNDLTNFVTDWNGDLVHAHTAGTVLKWSDTGVSTTHYNMTTKDIDFGFPSQRKKIYKVYISFRGDGSNAVAGFGVNGGAVSISFASNTFTNAGTNDWELKELGFTTSSVVNNIYSFRIAVTDSGSALAGDFEINDISIVYRLKHVK